MKKMSLFLFLVFCCSLAKAQTYTVTEAQLQKLEAICQSYSQDRQKVELQLNESIMELETLQKESETLKVQLQTERNLTRNLNESLTRYEISNAEKENAIIELTQEIAEKEQKMGKLKVTTVTLTFIVIGLLLALAAAIYVILKK